MTFNLSLHSGLIFGLEADPAYEVDENGNLTGDTCPSISFYFGFISLTVIFS